MAEDERDFTLEHLDQQIEQHARYLDAQASHLVEDLQQMYQADQPDSREDAMSLQRVQRRLEARLLRECPVTNIVALTTPEKHHERKLTMIDHSRTIEHRSEREKGVPRERKPARSHFSRALNMLAAALVVAVLIGSAVVLVNLKNRAQSGGQKTQIGAATHPTPKPLPRLDCSHVFTDPDIGNLADNGEHAVCLQRLETPLRNTATVANHKITLISAYADANRLLIKYAVSGKKVSTSDGGVYLGTVTIQGGTRLDLADGGGYYYDQRKQQTVYLDSFDTRAISASTTRLQVTAQFVALVPSASPGGADETSVNFTVPMQAAARIVNMHQNVVMNGHHLMLTNVSIAPSMTVITLTANPAIQPYPAWALTATVNGSANTGVEANPPTSGKYNPIAGILITASEDYMTHSSWVVSLNSQGEPLGAGHVDIRFTL